MTTSNLKYIALIFMILDHIGFFFNNLPYYIFLRCIGRLAAPIFFFCFVEGYKNTHDKIKYRNRLLISGIIMIYINLFMLIIFKLLNHPLSNINLLQPNMFFTFFVMFQILNGIDNKKYKNLFWLLFIPFVEYNFFAFISILIFRYIDNKNLKFILFVGINILLCFIMNNQLEIWMTLSSIILYFYNNKNGKYNSKIFYLIYPLHFYLIGFISIIIH